MMQKLTISTSKKKQVVDISDQINQELEKINAQSGFCFLYVVHTTCGITTADLDPGTDEDLLEAVEKMFPAGDYRHQHDPSHVGEHIMSSIIGPSIIVPVKDGELILGTWQRVVLVELSGPRQRNLILNYFKN